MKIYRDVEGLTNVEKMASGKKYLACQLGSRVGMLESHARFWIPRSLQNFQKFPKSMAIEVAGFSEYLKPYKKPHLGPMWQKMQAFWTQLIG